MKLSNWKKEQLQLTGQVFSRNRSLPPMTACNLKYNQRDQLYNSQIIGPAT